MAYIDFFCDASTGSNVNGGSDGGTVTYTSTNGNWSTSTNQFIPTDGTNPVSAGVTVGQFCSIYIDGATVAVFISKITAVTNAANGAITVSASLRAGTPPVTSATTRTIKVGGAWKGPNAASGFPVTMSGFASLAAAGDMATINLKNNATYSITANITEPSGTGILIQGYGSTVRDGGRAIIDGGTTGTSYILFTTSSSNGWLHADIKFQNNGLTGTSAGVTTPGAAAVNFTRCVFSAMRGNGVSAGGLSVFNECEFFGNNLANSASLAGLNTSGSVLVRRCYSHDNSGSNTRGFSVTVTSAIAWFDQCISDSNGNAGFEVSVTGGGIVLITNCDSYNNTNDGILIGPTAAILALVENCNLIKNGGWGINFTTNPKLFAQIYNNGFGSGTQANTSGATAGVYSGAEIGSITYASGVTPWNAPATGDFSITLAAAKQAGRGAFTETDGTNLGTIGFPDIGAAQATAAGGTGGARSTVFGG